MPRRQGTKQIGVSIDNVAVGAQCQAPGEPVVRPWRESRRDLDQFPRIDPDQATVGPGHPAVGSVFEGQAPVIRQAIAKIGRNKSADSKIRKRNTDRVTPHERLEKRAGFSPHQVGAVCAARPPEIGTAAQNRFLLGTEIPVQGVIHVELTSRTAVPLYHIGIADREATAQGKAAECVQVRVRAKTVVAFGFPGVDPGIDGALGIAQGRVAHKPIGPVPAGIGGPKGVSPTSEDRGAECLRRRTHPLPQILGPHVCMELHQRHPHSVGHTGALAEDPVSRGAQESAKCRASAKKVSDYGRNSRAPGISTAGLVRASEYGQGTR